jgi:hypothetical protein
MEKQGVNTCTVCGKVLDDLSSQCAKCADSLGKEAGADRNESNREQQDTTVTKLETLHN